MSTAAHAVPTFGSNFDDFLKFLHEDGAGASTLSPNRFSEILSIDMQTLARQARVHRNTLSRTPGSESVQRFLREVLRVLRAATDLSGNVDRAISWYRNAPLSTFDYTTAEHLVASGRTDDLLRYIQSLEAGAVG